MEDHSLSHERGSAEGPAEHLAPVEWIKAKIELLEPCRRAAQPTSAVRSRYFSGRNNSTTTSCAGTSGMKESRRWQ